MNIFSSLPQGDSAAWTDDPVTDNQGNLYTSAAYALAYTIAGPVATPLVLTAAANGSGWKTSMTPAQCAALTPGVYWWQAVITGTGVQVTAGTGELTITESVIGLSGPYDGRSFAEKALTAAQAALANLGSSGGVASYTIGGRTMTFSRATLIQEISYWNSVVMREQTAKKIAQGLGNPRTLHVRWSAN